MGDGNIPPPNFNFNKNSSNFEDDLIDEDLAASFQDYIDEGQSNAKNQRERIQEEIVQQEQERRAALKSDELEEVIEIEEVEEEETDQEDLLEKEADLDEKFADKHHKRGTPLRRRRFNERDKESANLEEVEEEESTKCIQDNNYISEDGEELEALEDDPLEAARKEMVSEQEELQEEIYGQKALNKTHLKKRSKGSKKDTLPTDEKKEADSKTLKATTGKSERNSAMLSPSSSPTTSFANPKAKKASSQPSAHNIRAQLQALANEILNEAEVLRQGDMIETTILLNLQDSIFNQGEITITAYRYRPLEVNLSFKKFSPDGLRAMQKNAEGLKKVLKEKSLKVHQLDIIE